MSKNISLFSFLLAERDIYMYKYMKISIIEGAKILTLKQRYEAYFDDTHTRVRARAKNNHLFVCFTKF